MSSTATKSGGEKEILNAAHALPSSGPSIGNGTTSSTWGARKPKLRYIVRKTANKIRTSYNMVDQNFCYANFFFRKTAIQVDQGLALGLGMIIGLGLRVGIRNHFS